VDPLVSQFRSLLNRLSPDNMKNVIKKLEDLVNPSTCVMLAKMVLEKSALEPKYVYVYAGLCNNLIKVCGNFRKELLC
jgi:hypothetical protein